MPEVVGTVMVFQKSVSGRLHWECPDCAHRTTTAKSVQPICTRCDDD